MIIRKVTVDYGKALKDVFKVLGCFQSTSISFHARPDSVFVTPPKERQVEDVEVHFFELKREDYCIDGEADISKLLEQYASRSLIPANPYELAAVNKDRTFIFSASNTTVWQSEDGTWQCLDFSENVNGVRILNLHSFDSWGSLLDHFESYPRLFAGVARS